MEKVLPVLAAAFNGNEGTLENIISKASHDINQVDSHQASALHLAVIYGHQSCITLLLENGASVDLRGTYRIRLPANIYLISNFLITL